MRIRPATFHDATAVARIYNHYILETVATFEEEAVSDDEMVSRISDVQIQGLPWIVLESNSGISGFAYAHQFRHRAAYRFTVESTIYLDPQRTGRGMGVQLYTRLIETLKKGQLHCVMGCISLPNEASIKLHERLGFEKAGHFPAGGFKFDRWVDVGYWQLML